VLTKHTAQSGHVSIGNAPLHYITLMRYFKCSFLESYINLKTNTTYDKSEHFLAIYKNIFKKL